MDEVETNIQRFDRNEQSLFGEPSGNSHELVTINEEDSLSSPKPPPPKKPRKPRKKKATPLKEPITSVTPNVSPVKTEFLKDLESYETKEEQPLPPPKPVSPKMDFALDHLPRRDWRGDIVTPAAPRTRPQRLDFSDITTTKKATPILGNQKRQLLQKIREYRLLFPDELGDFKVKNNATEEELNDAINEMDSIVNTSMVDRMLREGLLLGITTVEQISTRFPLLDITGTRDALAQNPEFTKLCKILWIKHGFCQQLTPESRMLLLVTSTAVVCNAENRKRHQLERLLDRPL